MVAFAGFWAALCAAHEVIANAADVAITVVSKDPYLTLRPGLYRRDPQAHHTPLAPSFEPLGIGLEAGEVTAIDATQQCITVRTAAGEAVRKQYDRLVLAAGSGLTPVAVPGAER